MNDGEDFWIGDYNVVKKESLNDVTSEGCDGGTWVVAIIEFERK